MSKLRKATKRITAVAASAALVASAVFGAGLSNYPQNFVKNGKFDGQVVIGNSAATIDSTSAASVIADLKAEFSGNTEKVQLTYKKSGTGGEEISAVDAKETLNFGEKLVDVNADMEAEDVDVLEDGRLDKTDYTQKVELLNGEFSYRIFDEVDGEDTAKAGLYYDASKGFAKYTMELDSEIGVSSSEADDLIGEEMRIMGNEFTVVEITKDKLVLVGGSNKISLGEGESTSVTIDGKSYEVSIQSVADTKVLLTVNGQSKTVDEYDTETIAGISVAATDLVSSSRDSVKGYAEIVIGGQKVELNDGAGVKVNDEDLEDTYEAYDVEVDFLPAGGDKFKGLIITYKVDDNTLLAKGDSLEDVLFDAFSLVYEGTNDVEYSKFEITTDNDEVKFSGKLFNGKEIPTEFRLTTDNVLNGRMYLGTTSKRIYFGDSDLNISPDLFTTDSDDAISYVPVNKTVVFAIDASTTDVKGNFLFSRIADDEFYLYEITAVDKTDLELDFEDVISGKAINSVDYDDVQASLELLSGVATHTANNTIINVFNLGDSELYLENELTMDFSGVETTSLNGTSNRPIVFKYNPDVDMDDASNVLDNFTLVLNRADDADDAIKVSVSLTNDFVSDDDVEEDSDYRVYVDHYGTRVTADEDNFKSVTIEVPDKEVEAVVKMVFGGNAAETKTMTVDADKLEEAKADLKADGYTIVKEEKMTAEAVEFDVTGAVLDSEVASSSNMIVVGGPAVNDVARQLMGIDTYTIEQAGVRAGEGVIKYYESKNSVLVYGYDGADTAAAVSRLNDGSLSGEEVKVN